MTSPACLAASGTDHLRGPRRVRRHRHRRHVVERHPGAHRLGLHEHPHRRRRGTVPRHRRGRRRHADRRHRQPRRLHRRLARLRPPSDGRRVGARARGRRHGQPDVGPGVQQRQHRCRPRCASRSGGTRRPVRWWAPARSPVPAYGSAPFNFTFDPGHEGGYDLFTTRRPGRRHRRGDRGQQRPEEPRGGRGRRTRPC